MSQMPVLVAEMDPVVLVKTAKLVAPLLEFHALPVTVFQPVALVVHCSEVFVFVATAARAAGARRKERRKKKKRLKAKG